MEKSPIHSSVTKRSVANMVPSADRRKFLRNAGLTTAAGVAFLAVGCEDTKDVPIINYPVVDLGKDDIGILNYAYALEQLEAAFYTQVIATPYTGISAAEQTLLTEIRDHEIIHRDFFKTALATNAIQALEVDFSTIDFTSRASVLGAAKVFEDTGVAAYNGAGKLIKDAGYLLLAGKIVSVEARHAAAIRDLLSPLSASFAGDDIIDKDGLDAAKKPADILTAIKPFVKANLNGGNLPTG